MPLHGQTDRHAIDVMCTEQTRTAELQIWLVIIQTFHWALSFFFSSPGPVPVVLQGSIGIPGELWPLCNITTPTEQPPWSNLSGVCQVSHLSHNPLTWPPQTQTPPPQLPVGGRRKGRALWTRRRAQPITEIHADLTNIMRFCFKNNNRNITMTLTNMTTLVQMRQRRPAARLSALSKPNLPDCQRLLVALRERSLCFYVNFIVILWFITSNVIV